MSSREITLWIDDRWYDALARRLKDETVEDKLNDYLDTLVNQLPRQEYEGISQEIYQEEQRAKEEQEAARKFAVFHFRENGEEHYLQSNRSMEVLAASRLLRSCLRSGGGVRGYMKMLSPWAGISAEQFRQMVELRMESTGKVTGAFELDFDRRLFSVLDIADGWKAYAMKDVSTASYYAQRKQFLSEEERLRRFLDRLAGKEITNTGGKPA